ncbi:hypothetical protein ETAA8_54620 [Anatilimnocola aggregata]|uniref:Uncharacterized protein n=2 Tax=Anatilimnocola aggregata TaxID=2528021 RepID=A0A517YJE6_9BACT|nr:hypothetical protein ETAA8_54620 [Anatilimnocola aggregata]
MVSLSEVLPAIASSFATESPGPFNSLHDALALMERKLAVPFSELDEPGRVIARRELCEAATAAVTSSQRGTLDHLVPRPGRSRLAELRGIIQAEVANIQETICDASKNVTAIHWVESRKHLRSAISALRDVEVLVLTRQQRRQRVVAVLIALPILLSAIAGLFLALQDGFELTSADMHFPYSVSSSGQQSPFYLTISESERQKTAREFSEFYFNNTGTYREKFIVEPAKPLDPEVSAVVPPTLFRGASEISFQSPIIPPSLTVDGPSSFEYRLKLDIRNRRRIGTKFVSDVSVRVRLLQERTFPWSALDDTPFLESSTLHYSYGQVVGSELDADPTAEWSFASFAIGNSGLGPALDVNAIIRLSSGVVLATGYASILHRDSLQIDLPRPGRDISPWPVKLDPIRAELRKREFSHAYQEEPWSVSTKSGSPVLQYPMYVELLQQPLTPDESIYFQHEGVWYQIIDTIADLRNTTQVYFGDEVLLNATYESLSGQKYELRHFEPMPFGWCYYQRTGRLHEFDPRKTRPAPSKLSVAAPAPTGLALLEKFASQFSPPLYEPKGVDHVTLQDEIDLGGIREGEWNGRVMMVDRFLNPLGTVSAYLKLKVLQSGRWEAVVSTDGMEIDRVCFDTLVPDALHFPSDEEARMREVERLRQHFRAAKIR